MSQNVTPTPEVPRAQQEVAEEPREPRYSKRLRVGQKAERRMSKASRRMAEAVVAGIETWEKRRDKSAGKKKDGAVKDSLENYARAYSETLRKASRVPEDVVKGMRELMPKRLQKLYGLR